jgi:hypothetical protein
MQEVCAQVPYSEIVRKTNDIPINLKGWSKLDLTEWVRTEEKGRKNRKRTQREENAKTKQKKEKGATGVSSYSTVDIG